MFRLRTGGPTSAEVTTVAGRGQAGPWPAGATCGFAAYLGACRLGEALEDRGHALPAADAHGLQAEGLVVELEAVEDGGGDPRPGHAERVAHRDGAAVHVQLVDVDAQLPVGRDDLGRERLVDLDQVDVVD